MLLTHKHSTMNWWTRRNKSKSSVESTFLKHSPPHQTNIPFILLAKQVGRHGFRNREWWRKQKQLHHCALIKRDDLLFIDKLLILVTHWQWIVLIYLEHESVLHPYSFKGNVISAIKQQYEPCAIVPWRSNPIGYGHPRQSALQKSQKRVWIMNIMLEVITLSYGYCDWQLCVLGRQTGPEPLNTFSSSSELTPLWFWEMLLL